MVLKVNMQQVLAAEELKYEAEIYQVMVQLDIMGMKPDSDIRIFRDSNDSWYAAVLVGMLVLLLTWYGDHFDVEIHPFSGFNPSGGLIHQKDL